MKKVLKAAAVAAFATLGLFSADVKAESILVGLTSVVDNGSTTTWNYSASAAEDDPTFQTEVRTGDYFTIHDFGGGIISHSEPANWVFSQAPVGPAGFNTNPPDSAVILNVTWTYTGLTPIQADALIGTFSLLTAHDSDLRRVVPYSATDHQTAPFEIISGNTSFTQAPLNPFVIPLPASAWGGIALFGAVVANRARKLISRA